MTSLRRYLAAFVFLSASSATFAQNQTPALLKYDGAVTAGSGGPAELAAVVLDNPAERPVEGGELSFTLGTQTCKAVTNAKGRGACTVTLAQPAGKYKVMVSFRGLGLYAGASRVEADFTITKGKQGKKH